MYSLVLALVLGQGADLPGQLPPLPPPGCNGQGSLYPPAPQSRVSLYPAITNYPGSPGDPVLQWNQLALEAIRSAHTPPPMAARNLAMVHVAIQDSVNSITGRYRPYLINSPTEGNPSAYAATVAAAHRVLTALYPNQAQRLEQAMTESLSAAPQGESVEAGTKLGQAIADRVLAWRARDGSDRSVFYRPREGMDYWLPTPPNFQPPLAPHWGQVTPFAMRNSADFRPAAPPPCDTKVFARSFDEVKTLGKKDSFVRTQDQTEIAHFWADGEGTVTPPGHWNHIARTVSQARGLTLVENARLFALLNIALADAGISCWDAKFTFDYVRPVTAIRRADHDGNPDTWSDPSWTPLLPTPPFPSYTSGHSTFSAAAAAVLAEVFGDEVRFTIGCDEMPNVRRSFARFSAAAAEAGRSRIYGGIHWDFDDEGGQKSGAALGRYVARNFITRAR